VFFLVSGLVGLPVAGVIARRDPRPLIAAGAVACGAALLLLGRADQVWQVYVAHAVFGAGFAASSLVPGTTLVTRWFARRRSVALSVASTGLSAGGVLLTPAIAALVRDHGLAAVTPWLALLFVVGVVPVTALLLHPSPQGARPAARRRPGAARRRPATGPGAAGRRGGADALLRRRHAGPRAGDAGAGRGHRPPVQPGLRAR
jgi:MFS family permease